MTPLPLETTENQIALTEPTILDSEGARHLLRLAVEQATEAIVITDGELDLPGPRILYVNPAFLDMTGYAAAEVLGQTPRLLQGPKTERTLLQWMRHCLSEGLPFFGQGINYRKNGQTYQAEWRITPIRSTQNEVTHFMASIRDITEHKQFEEQIGSQLARIHEYSQQLEIQKAALERANAQLRALATTDGLTGLRNHRDFHEQLEHEIQRAIRYSTPLSLILLDVDRFKQYNDAFGHPAGDEVLKTVADLLRRHARTTDLVSRYGGEEFAVLLPGTDAEGGLAAAEHLRAEIEEFAWPGHPVTISLGVATLSAERSSEISLLEQADKALYQSKGAGRNHVTHFSETAGKHRRATCAASEFSWPHLAEFSAIGSQPQAAEPDLSDGMWLAARSEDGQGPMSEFDTLDQS